MALETIFEVAGFITPRNLLYFRMLVRYDPSLAKHFEFLFDIRHGENITYHFLAVAEFGNQTPYVQFHIPSEDPLSIGLLSCVAKEAIGPIIICHNENPHTYVDSLKAKGLREIGTATIARLVDCLANGAGNRS